MNGIQHAIAICGNQARLARALGVSRSAISQLGSGSIRPSIELAIAIERETKGAVTVEELRPDVDWAVLRPRPPAPVREAA